MNYLISKELLSEVLGHKIWKILDCNMGTLRYCIYPNKGDEPSEYTFPTNIHELAHKCKEWAFDNFYLSIIVFKINDNLYKCEIADIRDSLGEWITKHSFKISTEHEAIFKATSYVMEQLKQKD